MNMQQLTGQNTEHLAAWEDKRFTPVKLWRLHRDAVANWDAMVNAALKDGVSILPISSFRDFDRQLLIWNEKINGLRSVHDDNGQRLQRDNFDEWSWCQKVLRFSALPGLSRHHWGSDLDVFDGNAIKKGIRPQLVESEFCDGGPCADLNLWLKQRAAEFGFFRPYQHHDNGIAPEPWHLSYRPVAQQFIDSLNETALFTLLDNTELAAKSSILPRLTFIIEHYVLHCDR